MALPATPTNTVAAHMGQGAVLIAFDPPAGSVNYYEIWGSDILTGPYHRYMNGIFIVPRGLVYNVPIGGTVYMQVRAVNNDGAGPFAQINKGTINKPTTLMDVTAIHGSRIPQDAIFSVPDEAGRIVAYKATAEVVIE